MAVDYKDAIIITGGKLIRNEATNPSNKITFQKISDEAGKIYLEVNVKIRIAETEIINTVRSLEGFKDEQEIKDTKNLIVLGTKKETITEVINHGEFLERTIYTLNTDETLIDVNFDKDNVGQIGIQIKAENVIKTDHGGDPNKRDHCYIPF